jgi:hypothetical protein
MEKTDRSEVLAGRFTRRERKAIEAEAGKQGFTVTEYIRSAVMVAMVMDGNVEAIKMTAALSREKIKRWIEASQREAVTT